MTTTILNEKIREAKKKILDNFEYSTTQEFNKLTTDDLVARLKQDVLFKKTDFDSKLPRINKRITSNKAKNNKNILTITKDFTITIFS